VGGRLCCSFSVLVSISQRNRSMLQASLKVSKSAGPMHYQKSVDASWRRRSCESRTLITKMERSGLVWVSQEGRKGKTAMVLAKYI
jgi:hypothetical protein